jgi:hypothetical protein
VNRAHGFTLALGGRCPLCAELSPENGVLSRTPCARCEGVFADESLAMGILDEYAVRSSERLWLHLVVLALAGLVLGFVPLLGAACLAVGFVLFQLRVVTPALALLSRKRRLVARWTLRLATATLGVGVGIAVTIASLAGVGGWVTSVGAPVTLGLTWITARFYLLAQLRREHARRPIAAVEVVLLVGSIAFLTMATLAVVALVVGTVGLIQLAIAKIAPWL